MVWYSELSIECILVAPFQRGSFSFFVIAFGIQLSLQDLPPPPPHSVKRLNATCLHGLIRTGVS